MVKICIVKQTQELDIVSYHKLFEILKQYQKEVNEIRAKKITRNANPLALVAATQQYPNTYSQAPKPQRTYAPTTKQSSSTRSNDSTIYKGKEIAKPITPPSESASEEILYKPTNNNLRTSSNSRNKNVDITSRYVNENQTGQFGNQRTMTVVRARETVGIQEVLPADLGSDVEPLSKDDSNVIPDSSNMCDNDNQADQNAE
ncbi:hypothetical protein Tco_0366674 [Tanacetum coccineum]